MKSKIIFWSSLIISLALAVVCGYIFCTRVTFENSGLESVIPAYIVLLFLSIIFSDLVHEGAHLIVGLICGMGIKPDKYRIFRTSSVNVFPKGSKGMRARMIATTSAGLIANLLCLVLGITGCCLPEYFAVFSVLLPYSVYIVLINAVPDQRNGAKNDGCLLFELITGADSARVMLQILRIQGMVRSGTKLSEVPEAMFFEVPQLPEDDLNFIILTQLRCEYYTQRGNDSEAYKYFLRFQDLIQYLPSEYVQSAPSHKKHNKAKNE